MSDIRIRPFQESDRHHINSTFIHTLHRRTGRLYPSIELLAAMEVCVEYGIVIVACLDANPDMICGWLAMDGDCLVYVHVKPAFRCSRAGVAIGSMLVREADLRNPVTCPYITHNGRALLEACGYEVKHEEN